MPLSKTRTIPVTTKSQYQDLEFTRSLRIDSYGCWVVVITIGGIYTVPPGIIGHTINLPIAVQNIDIDTTTPAGQTAGNGTAAVVTCYARWQTQSPGIYTSAYGGPAGSSVAITAPLANGDAVGAGLPLESGTYVFNGATWDRFREPTADAVAVTGLGAVGPLVWNGATWDRLREVAGDAQAAAGLFASGLMGWNGASWDRIQTQPTGIVKVQQVPGTTLGMLPFRFNSATATTGTIKASAGSLKGWAIMNTNAAARYLQIYNKASAPTLSTDTPVETFEIPAGSAANIDWIDGIPQGTGIAYAVTTDNVAIPTTAGAAGDIQGTVFYI